MKLSDNSRRGIIACSLFGLVVAQVGQAAQPVQLAPQAVRDVALQSDGALRGQLLDEAGQPRVKQPLRLLNQRGEVLASTETDAGGRFAFARLRGGVYQLQSAQTVSQVRAWTHRAAPPAATSEYLLVESGDQVVRGEMAALLASPWAWAALVAVAIAAPIAVDQADDDAT